MGEDFCRGGINPAKGDAPTGTNCVAVTDRFVSAVMSQNRTCFVLKGKGWITGVESGVGDFGDNVELSVGIRLDGVGGNAGEIGTIGHERTSCVGGTRN